MRLTACGTRGRRTELAWPGNKHLYAWNVPIGRLTHSLANASIDGRVAFSPDGKLLVGAGAIGSGSGTAIMWATATGKRDLTIYDPNGRGVNDVAFNPASRQLAVGNSGRSIFLWNVATQALVATLTTPGERGRVNRGEIQQGRNAADGNDHAYLWRNRQPQDRRYLHRHRHLAGMQRGVQPERQAPGHCRRGRQHLRPGHPSAHLLSGCWNPSVSHCGFHNGAICFIPNSRSVDPSPANIRRSEIVRAKDNVSAYSGA